eukprot:2834602-Amphidinium_carterae.1
MLVTKGSSCTRPHLRIREDQSKFNCAHTHTHSRTANHPHTLHGEAAVSQCEATSEQKCEIARQSLCVWSYTRATLSELGFALAFQSASARQSQVDLVP